MSKRRRRLVGLVPRLMAGVAAWVRWMVTHPQLPLAVGILGAAFAGLWGYAQRADAFRIAHVEVSVPSSLKLREPLVGRNLWELDLQALAGELERQQPWLKEVRVVRQLPDTLRIDPIPRTPIAQVRLDRWYPVDREGFILPEGDPESAGMLVRLVGFERAGVALRVGNANGDERMKLALRVLGILRRSPATVAKRITEVSVADPRQIRFVIGSGATAEEIEVRCGSETELEVNLKRLQAVLRVIAKQSLAVQYIDLRFQEPVVSPRT